MTRARVKRSVRGLPFFAHAARGACEYAGESELHAHAKAELLHAARDAGWAADVEVRERTPGGQTWRADVLCEHGRARVAFEVQRSGITLQDLHARPATYRASGVRALWLMRTRERDLRRGQPWQADTPALLMTERRTLPALGLPEFVHAALGGHLALFPAREAPVDLEVQQEPGRCYRCGQTHHLVRAVRFLVPGAPEVQVVIPGTHEGVGDWWNEGQWWPTRCVTWPDSRTSSTIGRRDLQLTAAQHDWVIQAAGQVWTYRSLLDP
ncbi:competence protein CoiA family protein [Deinococcus hohokamensis]|uniref:Competence protein CoiA family protein n=1 Tax=Deinococcus hohokamensis TaxID=309883 RepID=A0ABV9I739_9DEIO